MNLISSVDWVTAEFFLLHFTVFKLSNWEQIFLFLSLFLLVIFGMLSWAFL